ncbi:MAG TPA: ORF6N domain-containing protein [Candidatus Defluviicoccus seviourii]|nr:ORF6N domain-containing protein [Candidatus Defluviicoccus seviourii]
MTIPQTLFDLSGVSARIHHLPGRPPFILDADMATIYGSSTKAINQAVKRNPDRFPKDFCFSLTEGEISDLRSQNVTTNMSRALASGFTHAGSIALSGVLKTEVAARMSVIIHRAFAAMEAKALSDTRFMVQKLRSETLVKKPIYGRIMEGARNGWTFEQVWRSTSYTKYQLETAVREMVAMGMLSAPLAGMQTDLFAHA